MGSEAEAERETEEPETVPPFVGEVMEMVGEVVSLPAGGLVLMGRMQEALEPPFWPKHCHW